MPNIGDPAPQFSAVDVISNQTHTLSDYAGKVVLLVFSGPSWCPPCKFEAPVLQDLWEVFGNSATMPKVQFLMVSCFANETPQQFEAAIQGFGITFPALLNPGQAISNLYQVNAVPTLFFIDAEQKICNIKESAGPPADALYDEIYSMLIDCGVTQPGKHGRELSRWMAVMTILFGGAQDGGGLGFTPGGKPFPIDPWGPLGLSRDKRNILTQLAISELAKGVADGRVASEIEASALRGAEASIKRLVAKSALAPRELDQVSSSNPRGS